jgi:hypothetical protein
VEDPFSIKPAKHVAAIKAITKDSFLTIDTPSRIVSDFFQEVVAGNVWTVERSPKRVNEKQCAVCRRQ